MGPKLERFFIGFLGALILAALGAALIIGIAFAMVKLGPLITFPSAILLLAIFSGVMHATSHGGEGK